MIRIENIGKRYTDNGTGASAVLTDINITVPAGEFCCILGPSGCGKTTLLNLIAGFIKPSSGRILFNGTPVTAPGPERGVVFQDATLFPWLSTRKNVEFGLKQRGLKKDDRFRIATAYLELVGMAGHADAFPHTLSGGMRQRIAIARVLALDPSALLMDEPFSSLDSNSRERLQDELLRVWEAQLRTLIYVTHSVEEAVYLADRVIIMSPARKGICRDISLPLKRPRDRASAEFRRVAATLRLSLDSLPCCTKPFTKKNDLTQCKTVPDKQEFPKSL